MIFLWCVHHEKKICVEKTINSIFEPHLCVTRPNVTRVYQTCFFFVSFVFSLLILSFSHKCQWVNLFPLSFFLPFSYSFAFDYILMIKIFFFIPSQKSNLSHKVTTHSSYFFITFRSQTHFVPHSSLSLFFTRSIFGLEFNVTQKKLFYASTNFLFLIHSKAKREREKKTFFLFAWLAFCGNTNKIHNDNY